MAARSNLFDAHLLRFPQVFSQPGDYLFFLLAQILETLANCRAIGSDTSVALRIQSLCNISCDVTAPRRDIFSIDVAERLPNLGPSLGFRHFVLLEPRASQFVSNTVFLAS